MVNYLNQQTNSKNISYIRNSKLVVISLYGHHVVISLYGHHVAISSDLTLVVTFLHKVSLDFSAFPQLTLT